MMRKTFFLFLTLWMLWTAPLANAQAPNTITTVAGGATNSGAANTWTLTQPPAAIRDAAGNTYISDPILCVVYRVSTGGVLSIYAGNGIFGVGGDGGPATSAGLNFPEGLALDANGNLFIADFNNNRIRRVDVNTHVITTVAGSEDPFIGDYSGDGGLATLARMNQPYAVAVDANGNLFISDSANNVIRRVDASTQIITTYAGNGLPGTPGAANGDGGPATSAQFNQPLGVALDGNNNLFIADSNDSVVRRIDSQSQVITTYAGSPAKQGTFAGDGGAATAAGMNTVTGVFIDSTGNLYISDTSNERVRFVDNSANHIITTIAGNGTLCANPATACGDGAAATSASLNHPAGVSLDKNGNLLISDSGNQRIRTVAGGNISAFAGGASGGDGGAATSALLGLPNSVVVDSTGNLFIMEQYGERVRRVDKTTHNISTYAGTGARGERNQPNGDGALAVNANFVDAFGVAIDGPGNIYVVDFKAAAVRKIDATTKIISTVVGNGKRCGEPGNANTTANNCGDGGLATNASLLQPGGVAVDSLGNLYVSDLALNRVRIVNGQGIISNYAGTGTAGYSGDGGDPLQATMNGPFGMAADEQGNLFVADSNNNVIREIGAPPDGSISTYAFNGLPGFSGDGGPATEASMWAAFQVALDDRGNLYIGGGQDNVVRRVDKQDSSIITVAGDIENLAGGFSGDGGPSTKALIGNLGLTIDASHNLYIADGLQRVRKVNLLPVATEFGSFTPFPPTLSGTEIFNAPSQEIEFSNNGLDDLILTIASPVQPSSFQLDMTCTPTGTAPVPCTIIVPPGESSSVEVAFAPPAGVAGPLAANLTISTNDPASPSFNFPLSGTATNTAFALTVTVTPNGSGFVSSSPNGIGSCGIPGGTCSANFAQNSQVTLTEFPNTGFTFMGWSGAGCSGTGDCVVTMTQAQNVTATFIAGGSTSPLTVSATGNGSGTITSNPAGINCTYNGTATSGTCTANFPPITPITLTATPSVPGSTFAGWLGFCSMLGTNTCQSIAGLGFTTTAVFSVPPQAFTQGEIFAGASGGMIFVYKPDGTLAQVLGSGNIGGNIGGIAFDTAGNLYAANPTADVVNGQNDTVGTVERFGSNGSGPTTFGTGPFGNGYDSSPQSVVVAPNGRVFVAQSSGRGSLLRFPPAGGAAGGEFFPPDDTGPMQWIELLDDNNTILYTTAGSIVKAFDVHDNIFLPDFAQNLPGPAALGLRELADKTVLVADGDRIVRLNTRGAVIQTYQAGTGVYHSLNLDPDGVSFWTLEDVQGTMFRINITTGAIIKQFSTGIGDTLDAFNGFEGGLAVFGQPQSGGADMQVTMTAAPNPVTLNSNVTYTITVTNNGVLDAANVAMTDAFPVGVSFVSAVTSVGTCTGTTTVTCNLGTVANGATATISIVVTATQAGTLMNTVNVTSTTPDPITSDNSATTSTTVSGPTTTHFSVTAPATATNGTAFNVTVSALDATNAIVTGYTGTVHFTSTDAQAVLPANSTLTNGTKTFAVTLKTNGAQTVTATDTVTSAITGTSSAITVSSPAATHFSVSAPATANAGTAFNFTVTALDATNATATGYTGTVHFTSTDTQAVLPANATLTNGVGTFSATLKSSGARTITATDTVTASITGTSAAINAASAAATHFALAAPATATGGTSFNFTVTALDQFNNTATAYTGTMHFTSSDVQAVLPANSTLTNGTGTFAATLKTAGAQTIAATDTVTSSITGTSGAITVSVGAVTLTSIAVTPLTATIANGQTQQFTATGTFSDNSTQNLTITATWASSNPAAATISNTNGTQGLASAVANGSAFITATSGTVVGTSVLTVAQPVGFVLTGNLNTARTLHTATLLNNGMVLVAGGTGPANLLASAELYNPANGTFTATGSMTTARRQNTATLLSSGKVLITGGVGTAQNSLATAEVYDPASGTFTAAGSMTTSRLSHSATLLPDGTVLIAGGSSVMNGTGINLTSAEIYDPSTGAFTATGNMTFPGGGTATLLNNGKVLVAGSGNADLYDPATRTFTATGNMTMVRNNQTATLMNNGMVLVTGGFDSAENSTISAELYNPTTGTFSATGNMTTGRVFDTATLLNNGMVLIAGGYIYSTSTSNFLALQTAELYDPSTGRFTATGSMNIARDDHTATLLNNGKVLVVGGDEDNFVNGNPTGTEGSLASAELYTPTTLTPPGLLSIALTPANPSIAVGAVQQFIATGTFTAVGPQTLASVTWSSANTGVASISNDVGSKGFAPGTTPGTSMITASAGNISGSTLLTVGTPGADLAITITAPSNVAVGASFQYVITVTNNGPQDATGVVMTDPVPGNLPPTTVIASETCTRIVDIDSGATTLSCAIGALASGASTQIKFNVTPTVAGSLTNTASVAGSSTDNNPGNNSASVTTTVGGTAATHFSVTAPASATAGTPFNITVTALDASNATVTSYTGTVHFTSTDGQAVLPANATLTNGTGTFAATLKTNGAQTITATDTVTASITGTSATTTVSSAAATHFSVSAPATATAGTAFNFTVTALTASNTTATAYTGAVHFTSTDGNAILPANSALTNGVGTFSATLNSIGGQTISATDTEAQSITGTSSTITVGAVAAPQLTVQTLGTGTGTVTGAGINCTSGSANGCTTAVTAGTQVTLTAAAATGSTFTSWNTACPNLTNTTCTFTMPATAQMVTATFTLNPPTLQSIAVTPANPTEPINSTLQFHATGTFSDSSTKDLTNTVQWQSTNPEAATINETGLATTGSAADETTTISASQNDVTGSTVLTVSNSPITISVTPPPGGSYPPVPPGGQLAIGIVLTSAPGFTGTVTFGCTTDSPTITCQPNPASVAITPGGPTQVAIVLNTFCTGNTVPLAPSGRGPGEGLGGLGLLLLSMAMGSAVWMYKRNPRWALSFALLMLIALGGAACSSLPKGPNGATPPGNYTVTFSATANGVTTTTAPIHFTVQ